MYSEGPAPYGGTSSLGIEWSNLPDVRNKSHVTKLDWGRFTPTWKASADSGVHLGMFSSSQEQVSLDRGLSKAQLDVKWKTGCLLPHKNSMHTQRPVTSELILWSNLLPGPHHSYHKTALGERPVNCRSSLPFPLTQSQGIKVLV